jgi:hypothetical protein
VGMCKDQPLVFSLVIPQIPDFEGLCFPFSAHGHGTRSSERQALLLRLRYNLHRSFTNEKIHPRFLHNIPLLFTRFGNYLELRGFLDNHAIPAFVSIKSSNPINPRHLSGYNGSKRARTWLHWRPGRFCQSTSWLLNANRIHSRDSVN